jgi:hypothetical protein
MESSFLFTYIGGKFIWKFHFIMWQNMLPDSFKQLNRSPGPYYGTALTLA